MRKDLKNLLIWILGLVALIILSFRLYQSFTKSELTESFKLIFSIENFKYLFLCVLLMFVNWGIESFKWFKISSVVENISFLKAINSVLVGLAYGHLLPARSSEFLGKILFYSKKNRNSISVLHFVNAAFQMYVTVVIGIFMLLLKFNFYNADINLKIIIAVAVIIFLAISALIIYADKLHFLQKIILFSSYEISHLLKLELLALSFIRYFVFLIQFYLIFLIFNSQQSFNLIFVSDIAIYFLVTSVIPMISIIEVAVRSLVAIFVFKDIGISDLEASLIATLLWLINLVIPSIAGFAIVLIKFKLKQ
jgi:hypothetical protein